MADNALAKQVGKKMPERRKTRLEQIADEIQAYGGRVRDDFMAGAERSAQGLGDIVERGDVLTGIPRLALGGTAWMGAPVSAALSPVLGPILQPVGEAVNTYVGQPVEDLTGYPADITNDLAMTGLTLGAVKGLGVTRPYLARAADQVEGMANRAGYALRKPANVYGSGPVLTRLADDLDMSPEARLARAPEQGYTIDAYTGANRLDRLAAGIDPKRATSGPMPFFTDSTDLASQYALNKADNSAINELGDFSAQFTRDGKNLDDIGKSLSPAQKRDLASKLEDIGIDDDGNIAIMKGQPGSASADHWRYLLKTHKGDPIKAAKELWLESGVIFGNEADFVKVLDMAGLKNVEFDSPNVQAPGVLPVKLKIQSPLDTSDTAQLQKLLPQLERAAKKAPRPQYTQGGVDNWDKTTIRPEDWVQRLKDDLQNGTSHTWTVIPDWVTEFLKRKGYDGIKDTGGKMGGAPHVVYIPFGPEQVRSRFAAFDPKNIGKPGLSLGVAGLAGGAALSEDEQ